MKKFLLISCLAILGYSQTAVASAKFCQENDQKLAEKYNELLSYSTYHGNYDEEKLENATAVFVKNLAIITGSQQSLQCDWENLTEAGVNIKQSDDKKLQVFSWDMGTGGTLHEYDGLIQYIDHQGKIHVKKHAINSLTLEIFSTKIQQKPLYIIASLDIASNLLHGQHITLYQIQDKQLVKPKLIKTKSGLTDRLGFAYDRFSLDTRGDYDYSKSLFEFSPKNQRIRFPVVVENDEYQSGEVTNRWINYQFDGKYFIKTK